MFAIYVARNCSIILCAVYVKIAKANCKAKGNRTARNVVERQEHELYR